MLFIGQPLRIALIGEGTSAAGNTILGRKAFPLQPKTFLRKDMGRPRQIEVIIPGEEDSTDLKDEIVQCIKYSCPGPHAFLLVIPVKDFTKEDEPDIVKALQETFGEKAVHYVIVLFTGVKKPGGQTIGDCARKKYPKLIASCGGRHHVFNYHGNYRAQVVHLVKKIDTMVAANEGFFTEEMLQ